MATVIPVRFAYAVRDLWFDPGQTGAVEGDHVICSTERGTEIGLATTDPLEVSDAELARKTSNAALKPVLRVAGEEDLDRAEELARMGDDALPTFRRLVDEAELDMKPVGVEYLFGRERVVCYFAADERVDFRGLVRSLSHELHERIDMRQIGVREEAAVVGGFGHCGQELCCARIGLSFEPVSIRMAKEQDLPLTSNKISGACGRLMCCLRYEFEAYRDFKGRAPKRNAVIDTPLGKAKIIEYDTPKEQLALRLENGKTVRVPLAEMVASEAAVKKSEELHCPCRPDTVVRESLDKLTSPDVQMALAELDRKMGVLKEDELESEDIFVESKPRKRRSRRSSTQLTTEAAAEKKDGEAPTTSRRKRRRRTAKAAKGADGQQPKQQQAQQQQPKQQPQQQKQSQQAQGKEDGSAPEEKRTRRRRRHRSGSGGSTAGQQEQATTQTPKRRPGDRAGQKSGQTGGQGAQRGGQSAQKGGQAGQKGAQTGGQGGQKGGQTGQNGAGAQQPAQGAEGAPRRRRRRRGGRGRGSGGGGEAAKPTAE